jgi:hypothetical protein
MCNLIGFAVFIYLCLCLQAGVDDTAKAAGLTVGHIESSVEMTVDAAKHQVG